MRWRVIGRRGAIAASALVLVAAVAHLACTALARAELGAARAAVAAAGAPTGLADVRPAIAPDDDAAPAWYRVESLILDGLVGPEAFARDAPAARGRHALPQFVMAPHAGVTDPHGALPMRIDPTTWTADERAAVVALCDAQPALWRALATATDAPRCRFPLRYEDGPRLQLPQITWLRSAFNLIRLRIALAHERGDDADGCAWAARALRVADHLDDDALVITHLVADAVRSGALVAAARSIPACGDDAALRALADAAAAVDAQRGMVLGLDGERIAFGDWGVEHIDEMVDGLEPSARVGWRLYWSWFGEPLRLHDDACYLRAMLAARAGDEPALPRLAPRTRLLVPAMAICRRQDEEIARRCDLLIAAVAARRFRLATGAPPTSLADLADRLARAPRPASGLTLTRDGATVTLAVADPAPPTTASDAARAARAATFAIVVAP